MQYVETDLQKLQIKLKTEPRSTHEALEAEYAAAARAKPVRRPPDLDKSGGLYDQCTHDAHAHSMCPDMQDASVLHRPCSV